MSIRIGIGVGGFPFSGVEAYWRWVDYCEKSAIDSLWVGDRLISSQPLLEPMATLGLIAGRTSRLKFGMNAVVLPFRDPLVLAKECATIDFLSNGRLLPVFGVGNDPSPDWEAIGRDVKGRGTQSNEMIVLLSRLWSEDNVTFEGKFYNYKNVTISPKPKQAVLPLWIGGGSAAAIERTARYGTGWLGGFHTPEQIGPIVTQIRARTASLGRSIEDDHYGANVTFRFGSWDEPLVQRTAESYRARVATGVDPRSLLAVGGAGDIIALVERFIAQGISKFVMRPLVEEPDDVLEQTRRLNEEVIPTVHAMTG